jgi:hypothetical protein
VVDALKTHRGGSRTPKPLAIFAGESVETDISADLFFTREDKQRLKAHEFSRASESDSDQSLSL